jgi:hypothetical protein
MARKLYSVQQYIKKVNGFKSYIQKIKPSDDFTLVKERLIESIDIMLFHLEDIAISKDEDITSSFLNSQKTLLISFKNTIVLANNLDDLVTVTSLLDLLNTDDFNALNEYSLSDKAFNMHYGSREGFIGFPEAYLQLLRNTINNENINIFFPNCYDASNAAKFRKGDDKTYGQTNDYASSARTILTRLAKGHIKGSIISNNFFDALFLVSKVGYLEDVDHMGVVKEPNERIEIRNMIKYLRPGGLFLITIPYTRILPSLAMYLSKVLSDVQIVRVPNGDPLKRVTIMGTKNLSSKTSNPEIYNKLKLLNYETDTVSIHDLQTNIYNLPTQELTLEMFRGSELDKSDVLSACEDTMIDSFMDAQLDPLVVKDQSPLLPFNIGQVGLVLTSGCLDGVIEEMEGINHVIKGMTTKVVSTNREDLEDNKIKCTETINNQVKINVFTADGKYIQLG